MYCIIVCIHIPQELNTETKKCNYHLQQGRARTTLAGMALPVPLKKKKKKKKSAGFRGFCFYLFNKKYLKN